MSVVLERGLNRYGNESGVQNLVNVMFYSCTSTAGGSNRGARDRGAEPDYADASACISVTKGVRSPAILVSMLVIVSTCSSILEAKA